MSTAEHNFLVPDDHCIVGRCPVDVLRLQVAALAASFPKSRAAFSQQA